jgi:hypothetical protein
MTEWLSKVFGNVALSWAAWAQDRYFEPVHYNSPWVVYSHEGTIELMEEPPRPNPSIAVWRRISDTENYERVDTPIPTHEAPTPLPMPIIQAVVRQRSTAPRQRRSRIKPRDFDITEELARFGGFPKLDWMHVGLCVKHRYGVPMMPGHYTLSIIDGALNLHELDIDEAAVYSVCLDPSGGLGDISFTEPGFMQEGGLGDLVGIGDGDVDGADGADGADVVGVTGPEIEPEIEPETETGTEPEHDPEQDPEPLFDDDDDDGVLRMQSADLEGCSSSPEPDFDDFDNLEN